MSIDTKGNIAIQGTYSTTVTTGSGLSATTYKSITNAPSIENLEDIGYQAGASVGIPVPAPVSVTAGGDFSIIPSGTRDNNYYVGVEIKVFKRIIKVLVVLVVIVFMFSVDVKAGISTEEFETVSISQEKIDEIWDSVNLRGASGISSSPIVSFDVSEENNVVIGLNENKIIIKDSDNELMHCYQFDNMGTFYVQWRGENILLFLVRSSVIIEISMDCEFVSMVECDTRSIRNAELWRRVQNSKNVTINDYEYSIKNDMGVLNLFSAYTYSQLIRVDSIGNKTVFYDVNKYQMERICFLITVVVIFILIVIFTFVKCIVKGNSLLSSKKYSNSNA